MSKPKKIDPEQPYVGVFDLGSTHVEVYGVTNDNGGSYYFRPAARKEGRLPHIKIGLRHSNWAGVVSVALHESFEFLMSQRSHAYDALGSCGDTQNRMFVFNHGDLCELCYEQSFFIAQCLPELVKVWKKYRPKD